MPEARQSVIREAAGYFLSQAGNPRRFRVTAAMLPRFIPDYSRTPQRCRNARGMSLNREYSGFIRRLAAVVAFGATICTAVAGHAQDATLKASDTPPTLRREFRGVWIATVGNEDWPSQPGLTAAQQQQELNGILDRAQALHLNAVLLQVRPACDALYASANEPWSPYLTGMMGKPPDTGYDPLQYAVDAAHQRGLEIHAWFNPFRALQSGEAAHFPPSSDHISRTHPEWARAYGGLLWLDPGLAAVRDYSLAVIADVVRRYDIDGVHLDDFFYPYQIKDPQGHPVDFPDAPTFAAYRAGGGKLSPSDWRRANIDDFVKRVYATVKRIKPYVKVGISPFGIWRPGHPAQIRGLDSYESLASDSRRWLHEGWVDYLSPQLYWRVEQTAQSYPALLSWWIGENALGRHLWPGLYTSRAETPAGKWPTDEIEYQIKTTRGIAGASGNVHFSAHFLLPGDPATPNTLPQHLLDTVYADLALVPRPRPGWNLREARRRLHRTASP